MKDLFKAFLAFGAFAVVIVAMQVHGQMLNSADDVMLGSFEGDYDMVEVSTGTTSASTLSATLGSIIVADSSSAAASVLIYATSSHSVATSSNDLFMTFDAQAAEGTYVFDVAMPEGILIDVTSGNDGDIQVTYRR